MHSDEQVPWELKETSAFSLSCCDNESLVMPSVPKSQVHSFQNQQNKTSSIFFSFINFVKPNWLSGIPTAICKWYMKSNIPTCTVHWEKKKKSSFPISALTCYFSDTDIHSDTARNKTPAPDAEKNTITKIFCTFSFFSFPIFHSALFLLLR